MFISIIALRYLKNKPQSVKVNKIVTLSNKQTNLQVKIKTKCQIQAVCIRHLRILQDRKMHAKSKFNSSNNSNSKRSNSNNIKTKNKSCHSRNLIINNNNNFPI